MPTEDFMIADNLSYVRAFEILEQSNLTQVEVNSLVWGLLGETLGKSKRVFNYAESFSASAAGCTPSFARSFVHTDWIDGESVVQAEENSIEEGFNSRFHKIEDDLDALAADIAKSFACIGDMRAELADRLTELRTEINRINTDIHACCNEEDGGGGWTVWPGFVNPSPPVYPYPLPPYVDGPGPGFGGPIGPRPGPWRPMDPWVVEGGPWIGRTGPLISEAGGTPWTTPVTLEALLTGAGTPTFPGPAVTRSTSDPARATVGGMPARRLDIKSFNGQLFEVWSSSGGIVMTPAPDGVAPQDQAERAWENRRARAAADIAAWAAVRGRDLEGAMDGGTTVRALVETFGDDRLEGGTALRDALSVLPSATRIGSPAELLSMVADRAAMGVARDGMVAETLVANIGFNAQFKRVTDVPIAEFKAIPAQARRALEAADVPTLGRLVEVAPAELAEKLTEAGVETSAADVGRWMGEAMVLDKLAAAGPRRG